MTTEDLIRELERTRDETLGYFALGEAELEKTYGPGKWSIRFILHHLTESEVVFRERLRRITTPVAVDHRVSCDPIEPGPEPFLVPEASEVRVDLEKDVLKDILGIRGFGQAGRHIATQRLAEGGPDRLGGRRHVFPLRTNRGLIPASSLLPSRFEVRRPLRGSGRWTRP